MLKYFLFKGYFYIIIIIIIIIVFVIGGLDAVMRLIKESKDVEVFLQQQQ